MANFQTKNSNLGKFWRVLNSHLVYFTAMWYILWPFGLCYGYLMYFPILVCCTKKKLATLEESIWSECQNISESEIIHPPHAARIYDALVFSIGLTFPPRRREAIP
jgi:hypothetical protein